MAARPEEREARPRWVDAPDDLAEVVAEALEADSYAIDTEFHRERTYYPHLALVQLAWPGGLALIDPLAVDVGPLRDLLASDALAILHAAEQDLEVLDRACGRVPARLFDTQLAAGFAGFSSPSLASLCERLLGIRLPKGDRLTDWTRRPLTPTQLTYAASDVTHLHELHSRIEADLVARGRLAWAMEECELSRLRSRLPQDPDTAWWRLKDGRGLRGKHRGVAQAVAAWRERRAAAQDVPPRFVVSDMALLGIANRVPEKRSDLEGIRGLDGRQLREQAAEELIAAVQAGVAMPEAALRLPPVDDVERTMRPAVTLVGAWVAQLGRDLDVDPALLGTRADVQALLRNEAGARLSTGWRADLVGEPVRRLVAGEAALAFEGDSLVLIPRPGT